TGIHHPTPPPASLDVPSPAARPARARTLLGQPAPAPVEREPEDPEVDTNVQRVPDDVWAIARGEGGPPPQDSIERTVPEAPPHPPVERLSVGEASADVFFDSNPTAIRAECVDGPLHVLHRAMRADDSEEVETHTDSPARGHHAPARPGAQEP